MQLVKSQAFIHGEKITSGGGRSLVPVSQNRVHFPRSQAHRVQSADLGLKVVLMAFNGTKEVSIASCPDSALDNFLALRKPLVGTEQCTGG